jgi:hypothetical protein
MPTQAQDKQHTDPEIQKRQQRNAVIGKHVLHTLGQPGDLHRVQVRPLWEDHYRVNILVGADAVSAKVAHSYFLVADSDGNIIASTPKITRQYEPVAAGSQTLSSPLRLPAPSCNLDERKDQACGTP